jgi:fucose 4-O-acetylase-like acetyltransferase
MNPISIISSSKRNSNIDFARGLAILIMILANSAPYLLNISDVPFYLRFIFSAAAPIFIFLSGYSLNLSFQNNKSLTKIIIR